MSTMTYSYRNEAVSTDHVYASAEEALAAAIAKRDWAEIDSEREARYIADGSWLLIHDSEGVIVMERGEAP